MISTFLTIHFDSMLLTSWYYSSFLELFSLYSHEYLIQTVNPWICVKAASAKISRIHPKESNVTLPHKKHLTFITVTDVPLVFLFHVMMWLQWSRYLRARLHLKGVLFVDDAHQEGKNISLFTYHIYGKESSSKTK